MIGVGLSILTIIFSMLAFWLRDYMYSIVSPTFFDKTGELINCKVAELRNLTKEGFYIGRIEDYFKALYHNEKQNKWKARMLTISQILFVISIVFLLGAILFLLELFVTGQVSINVANRSVSM
jgi:hypothetical protein